MSAGLYVSKVLTGLGTHTVVMKQSSPMCQVAILRPLPYCPISWLLRTKFVLSLKDMACDKLANPPPSSVMLSSHTLAQQVVGHKPMRNQRARPSRRGSVYVTRYTFGSRPRARLGNCLICIETFCALTLQLTWLSSQSKMAVNLQQYVDAARAS